MKKPNHPITDTFSTSNKVHVCALVDHEDGNAYEVACVYVPCNTAFITALTMLRDKADQVCIISDEDYLNHSHDLFSLAPHSIIVSKGIYA